MENINPSNTPSPKKKKKNSHIPLVIILIIIFLVCLFLSSGMLAYKFGVKNSYLKAVTSWIPYPAARVNSDTVSLADYFDEVDVLRNVVITQGDEITPELDEKIKSDVIDKLIHDKIVEQLAKEFKVKVTEEQIAEEKQKVFEEIGVTREELDQRLNDLYGWDFDIFFDRVVLSSVYQEKVREGFFQSEKIQKQTEKKAKEVLAMVKKGDKSFQDIAKEYSDDDRFAQLGGDWGWVAKGVLPAEVEEAAFSMEKGDISDLIKTDLGYHIIKIEDKKDDGSEVWVYDIFISYPDFEQYLLDYLAESKVSKFVK